MIRLFLAAALLALSFSVSHGEDAPKPAASPPVYTLSEAQMKAIAELLVQRRDAAAAEYKKLDEILAEIIRQATALAAPPTKSQP